MSDIPTTLLVPTVLTAAQTQDYFVEIVGNLSSENAHEMLARAYELGRKHGRESADAENALLLEATETVHNRTTDNTMELVVGTVLSAVADKSYKLKVDPDTNEVGVVEVILRQRDNFWGNRFVLKWLQDGAAAIDSTTVVTLTRKR